MMPTVRSCVTLTFPRCRERESLPLSFPTLTLPRKCFRYLTFLLNLATLKIYNSRVSYDAPIESVPRTVKIVNLDHIEADYVCDSELRPLPNLHTLRLQKTVVNG